MCNFFNCFLLMGLGVLVNKYEVFCVLGKVIIFLMLLDLVISMIKWLKFIVKFLWGGALNFSVFNKKLNFFCISFLWILIFLKIFFCIFFLWILMFFLLSFMLLSIILYVCVLIFFIFLYFIFLGIVKGWCVVW